MEKIHREAAQWKYYFMKYDILIQTFTSSLVRKQYLPKTFLAQKFEKKNCQYSFQAIIRLKKTEKSGMDH